MLSRTEVYVSLDVLDTFWLEMSERVFFFNFFFFVSAFCRPRSNNFVAFRRRAIIVEIVISFEVSKIVLLKKRIMILKVSETAPPFWKLLVQCTFIDFRGIS